MKYDFNISAQFLVPCLMLPIDKLEEGDFNSYINFPDLNDINIINPLYLLVDLSTLGERYEEVVSTLITNKYFVMEQRIDKDRSIFCFKFPDEYSDDYNLILEGKYSKTSDKYRACFKKYEDGLSFSRKDKNTISRKLTFWHQVFTKDQHLLKYQEERLGVELLEQDELWDKIDIEKETLLLSSFPDAYSMSN